MVGMKHTLAVAAALLASLSATTARAEKEDKAYTLTDLEALVEAKSYQEAVEHLKDVRPSERKDKWLSLAIEASSGLLSSITGDHIYTRVMMIEQIDDAYPQLLKAPKYLKARAELGLPAYTACFEQPYVIDECVQHATKFLDKDASNTALAFGLGKALRRNAFAYFASPFLARGLGKKPTEAQCKDEDLRLAAVGGLGLPEDHAALPASKQIASGPCFPQLKAAILKEFDEDSENGYTRRNACPILIAKKALSGERLRACDKVE